MYLYRPCYRISFFPFFLCFAVQCCSDPSATEIGESLSPESQAVWKFLPESIQERKSLLNYRADFHHPLSTFFPIAIIMFQYLFTSACQRILIKWSSKIVVIVIPEGTCAALHCMAIILWFSELLMDREATGYIQVSKIATERLLKLLTETELLKRGVDPDEIIYMTHYFG